MLKKLHLIFTVIALLANLAVCFVIPGIGKPAIITSFAVILVTGLASTLTSGIKLKDGFKISLPFVFIFFGVIEYILSFFMSSQLEGSFAFLGIVLLFLIEVATASVSIAISRHSLSKD